TRFGERSIDFADPQAVQALNRALLALFYGISKWEIPPGFLCPPVPGRADYVHSVADLLASCNGGAIPRGPGIRVLDVGVGANCIFPIIGHGEYGWRFVGTDIAPQALASARAIAEGNRALAGAIELRLQPTPAHILKGLYPTRELFDLTVCNPPFHESPEAAHEGSRRKWKNLKRKPPRGHRNFGGHSTELWCPGGEAAFIRRLIEESVALSADVFWFTTLVSKEANLPAIHASIKKARATDCRTLELAHGQKRSRVVAWTFLEAREQQDWRRSRFNTLP
ncbi:MAG: 23S rRNA (adenine(1618)-N(6))-methyltransferase RlmF, partial [Oligoflexia bacterium]|nr:23S rRNA (adenine(1618)-N(6))-methyltransferase RlmF [Oligoflexia bacterium]